MLTDSVQPRTIAAQIQRQVGIPTSQVRSGAKSNVKWEIQTSSGGGESDVKSAIAHTPSPAPLLFFPSLYTRPFSMGRRSPPPDYMCAYARTPTHKALHPS